MNESNGIFKMGQSELIVALDLGSSRIIAMAGGKNEQGLLSVAASAQIETDACIRRGLIHNMEETAEKVTQLIKQLEKETAKDILKVYVGVGGQSLRSEKVIVSKDLNGAMVDADTLKSLSDEWMKQSESGTETVLQTASVAYVSDGHPEPNPRGIWCRSLEAQAVLLLGRPFKNNLQSTLEGKVGLSVAGYIPLPVAVATAVLSETEKKSGCALIDFGAETTTLSIYKNSLLKYVVTIPLGGNTVTKDICSLDVSMEEAERLKKSFGSALVNFDDDEMKKQTTEAWEKENRQSFNLNELNDVIQSRMDEILANVIEQIRLSECQNELEAGIVITGGGAALKNLLISIREKTNMNVRLAAVKKTLVNQAASWATEYANAAIAGLLALGTENCVQETQRPVETKPDDSYLFADVETIAKQKNTSVKTSKPNKLKNALDKLSKGLFDQE
ncbi:MAG: cell division protein FtsA [Dysgonamonadaceae bacterium]|nr:cell division protein FtsA [Dysgonamonadaceae bacterium]